MSRDISSHRLNVSLTEVFLSLSFPGGHESACSHPNKSGREIIGALEKLDCVAREEQKLYDCIFELLSFEKITFNDLQFKGYRTEEFIHRLYYETSRFQAFSNQWVVKARVNNNEKDPSQVCERRLTYQLVLKCKPSSPISVQFLILKVSVSQCVVIHLLTHHSSLSLSLFRARSET